MSSEQKEISHPFFFGNSVKSNYIYTDENTTTFRDLLDRNVVYEISVPSYSEYHSLEKRAQADVKTKFLKFIIPVSMVSLQRRAEFANRVELIILDIDNGDGIPIEELHSQLRELDFSHWIYTTISHTPDHPKYRVIVEADGQMTPDFYNQCVIDLSVKLNLTIGPPNSGSNIDSTSKDVVHAMFLPAKFSSDPSIFEEIKFSAGRAYSQSDIDWDNVESVLDKFQSSKSDETINYAQPPMEGLSKEMITTVLKQIQHMAIDYDDWVHVGMAIHHQFAGSSEGIDVWDEWSRRFGGEKYDRDDLRKTWESFAGHRAIDQRNITFRSCFSWAMQEDWKPTLTRDDLTPLFLEIQDLRDKDVALNPEEIRLALDNLAERIRYTPMAPEHREELILEATAVAKEYSLPLNKSFFKSKFGYANVLSLAQDQAPSWCKNHVYIKSQDLIYVPESGYAIREVNYNNVFNSVIRDSMPYDPEANSKSTKVKPSPWERALDWYHIPKVDDLRFAPGKKPVFNEKDGTYYNTYRRPNFKIKERANWTPEESAYIDKLREHLRWMYDDHHILTVLSFLAVTIFEPQTKIRWAIFLHSYAQGIGKSLFYEIARTVMGESLISTVKSKQLSDLSTKWKDSKKLVIVEEASLSPSIMEDLKDDISNNRMVIRTMYKDSVEVPNYVNFIFISNNLDGIEIKSEKDRRYYIASSPIQNRGDMYKRLKDVNVSEDEILEEMQRNQEFGADDADLSEDKMITKSAFSKHIFDELFDGIDKYSAAISGWMLEIYQNNGDKFDRTVVKLTNEYREQVRAFDDPIDSTVQMLIEDEVDLASINSEYILSRELYDILFGDNPIYKGYHLSERVRAKHGIHTTNSLRGVLIRKFGYRDLGTFVSSSGGKTIRQRVLTRNTGFFRKYTGNEKELFELVANNLKNRKITREEEV